MSALLISLCAACAQSTSSSLDGGASDAATVDLRRDGGPVEPTGMPNCRPDNCTGCCKNDICVDGDEDSACGSGGISCDTCGMMTQCRGRLCATLCGPDTCAGCCKDNGNGVLECQGGGAAAECGKGGATCIDCGAGGLCSLGVCVDPSCATSCAGCCDGNTCRAGNSNDLCGSGGATCDPCSSHFGVCTNSACVLDPNSRWDVQLISAEMPEKNASNSSWDTFTQPDPYIKVTTSDGTTVSSAQSPTVDGTRTPTWTNYRVLQDVTARQLMTQFKMEMWEDDSPDGDDFVGDCQTTFDADQFNGLVWIFTCPANPNGMPPEVSWSMRIRLYPH